MALALAGAALSACSTLKPSVSRPAMIAAQPAPVAAAPKVVTHEVVVKEPVKCVPRALPPAPRYPDSDAALREAGGAADRYQLLAAGRILRAKRLALLEKVIEGCR